MNDGPLDAARAELIEAFEDLWRRSNNTIVSYHGTLEQLRHTLGCISDEEMTQRNAEWLAGHKAAFEAYHARFMQALFSWADSNGKQAPSSQAVGSQ